MQRNEIEGSERRCRGRCTFGSRLMKFLFDCLYSYRYVIGMCMLHFELCKLEGM